MEKEYVELTKILEEGWTASESYKGAKPFIFLGREQIGKSTLTGYMMGHSYKKDPASKASKPKMIFCKNPEVDLSGPSTGDGDIGHTIVPSVHKVFNKPINVADFAGYGDTGNCNKTIAREVFRYKAATEFQSINGLFIFLPVFDVLFDPAGKSFSDLIKNILDNFEDLLSYRDRLIYLMVRPELSPDNHDDRVGPGYFDGSSYKKAFLEKLQVFKEIFIKEGGMQDKLSIIEAMINGVSSMFLVDYEHLKDSSLRDQLVLKMTSMRGNPIPSENILYTHISKEMEFFYDYLKHHFKEGSEILEAKINGEAEIKGLHQELYGADDKKGSGILDAKLNGEAKTKGVNQEPCDIGAPGDLKGSDKKGLVDELKMAQESKGKTRDAVVDVSQRNARVERLESDITTARIEIKKAQDSIAQLRRDTQSLEEERARLSKKIFKDGKEHDEFLVHESNVFELKHHFGLAPSKTENVVISQPSKRFNTYRIELGKGSGSLSYTEISHDCEKGYLSLDVFLQASHLFGGKLNRSFTVKLFAYAETYNFHAIEKLSREVEQKTQEIADNDILINQTQASINSLLEEQKVLIQSRDSAMTIFSTQQKTSLSDFQKDIARLEKKIEDKEKEWTQKKTDISEKINKFSGKEKLYKLIYNLSGLYGDKKLENQEKFNGLYKKYFEIITSSNPAPSGAGPSSDQRPSSENNVRVSSNPSAQFPAKKDDKVVSSKIPEVSHS